MPLPFCILLKKLTIEKTRETVYNSSVRRITQKGCKKMAAITKDMIIGDVLKVDINLARFLMEMGMHCIGCPASRGETVEDAAKVHGVDPDELVEKMNNYLEAAQYEA